MPTRPIGRRGPLVTGGHFGCDVPRLNHDRPAQRRIERALVSRATTAVLLNEPGPTVKAGRKVDHSRRLKSDMGVGGRACASGVGSGCDRGDVVGAARAEGPV